MKSLRLVLALLLVTLSFSACDFFEQEERTFTDDPQIEFFPLTENVDEGDLTVTTKIQLIGPQRDSDLPVSFAVSDESTAQEGTHYNLNSTSATIPANSSSTEVTIDVLDNDQDDGDTNYELILELQDSEGVEAAENLKTYTLTIRGQDEEDS